MAEDDISVKTAIQKCGVLSKKPFGHSSSKWSRRFFILKDGFILYYAEKEAKTFQQSGVFDIHPKGVIPLGGCCVEECADPQQPFAMKITHPDFGQGQIFLGADSKESLQDWIHWIQESSRVTYRNACLGDVLVASLKAKGTELERQMQESLAVMQKEAVDQTPEPRIYAAAPQRTSTASTSVKESDSTVALFKEYRLQRQKLDDLRASGSNVEELDDLKMACADAERQLKDEGLLILQPSTSVDFKKNDSSSNDVPIHLLKQAILSMESPLLVQLKTSVEKLLDQFVSAPPPSLTSSTTTIEPVPSQKPQMIPSNDSSQGIVVPEPLPSSTTTIGPPPPRPTKPKPAVLTQANPNTIPDESNPPEGERRPSAPQPAPRPVPAPRPSKSQIDAPPPLPPKPAPQYDSDADDPYRSDSDDE